MTVAELIAKLQEFPQDFEVMYLFDADFNDISEVKVTGLFSHSRGSFEAVTIE